MIATSASHRFWDHRHQAWTVPVLVGERYVTDRDEELTTVLGSCVAICVRDRVTGVGGMNHLLLPGDATGAHGLVAALLHDVLAFGGRASDLEPKAFGGARVIGAGSDVGSQNVAGVRTYLAAHGLTLAQEDVGGTAARRLRYHPRSGRSRVQCLPMNLRVPGAPR